MQNEFSADSSSQSRTFIAESNPESCSFELSSSPQHIQDKSPPEYSSRNDNDNHHSESQPSVNVQCNNQNPARSYHIESVDISDHNQIKQLLLETKTEVDNKSDDKIDQSSLQHSSDINSETNSYIQSNLHEILEEFKTQREIKETEILSSAASIDQSLRNIESNTFSNQLNSNIINTRPLNELEILDEQNQNKESLCSLSDVINEKSGENHNVSMSQTEPDDILGNKSLLKHTITPGKPDTRPTRGAIATVSYKLFLIDDSTADSHLIETVTNESFFVSESDILPAIDISIQLMDRGEHAFIDADIRHGYGEIGCIEKEIPPVSSNIKYRMKIDLEFHDWKDAPDIQTLSIDERLHWSDKKRQRGNFSYRRKEYSIALQSYRSALKFLNTDQYPLLEQDTESSIFAEQYIQVQNNLAQVHLLNNQFDQCLDAVNEVLKHDPKNIKASFRQAKALFELGNYDQTIPILKLLLQSQNNDVERDKINDMLNICKTKLEKYKKNEKEICRRMFSSPSSTTTTITTVKEKLQSKNIAKVENKNKTAWWTYVAMGSAVLAAVGLAAIAKYR
ncbi:unnamed protein product [Rotaria magnacalcarata]